MCFPLNHVQGFHEGEKCRLQAIYLLLLSSSDFICSINHLLYEFLFKKKLNAAKVSGMGESVETHFDVKLWCRKAETDTANPLGGQTDHWSCTLKAVLHMPLPCPTPASHLQVQLTITALVEEGMLAQACVLLIHTRTMFYHLSDEMAETGDRAGESQLSFRICHWRPSSGSNMTVCIVARHMGWKSHGTTIHCWGHNSCLLVAVGWRYLLK